tara:strand:- start:945 stop:2123 length:1179 start_codon:yes stop_codon:yes gene_type:complete
MIKSKKLMHDSFMEVLKPSMGAGAYIKDFRKSDAPQFKGKSEKERDKMAIAAYLDAKDEVNEGAKNSVISMTKFQNPKILKQVSDIIKKVGTDKIKVKKIPGGMELAGTNVHLTQVIDSLFNQTIKRGSLETPALIKMKEDEDHNSLVIDEEVEQLDEKIAGLEKKSDQTGVPYGILKKSYDRGVAAWRTGHRPGTTPQQWAFARVNSMLTGGKADPDLQAKIRAGGYKKKKKAKKEDMHEDGHMDVPSSIRMCKTIIEDANEIGQILSSKGDENIDTWWTNKLAVAASSLNKLRDYIKNPMEEGRKSKYAQDDEDEEGANKHIVMQLRKTVDLKGNFKTEFEDGKKQKIPLEIARKLSTKYNMLKKPIEKEIFQKRIAKSYRDLLKVAKEK